VKHGAAVLGVPMKATVKVRPSVDETPWELASDVIMLDPLIGELIDGLIN